MTTTLPPYSPLPPELPPQYSSSVEGQAEGTATEHATETTTDAQTPAVESTDHHQYDQPPSLLNRDTEPLVFTTLPRVHDHYILTLAMMILCGILLNFPAFLCLVPALSYSRKSKRASESNEYMEARSKAQWALWLNMAALVSYLVVMIITIGIIVAFVFSL